MRNIRRHDKLHIVKNYVSDAYDLFVEIHGELTLLRYLLIANRSIEMNVEKNVEIL